LVPLTCRPPIQLQKLGVLGALSLVMGYVLSSGLAAPLQWQQGPGYRYAHVAVPQGSPPGFTAMPATVTGIAFTNRLDEERGLTNQIYMSGAGVALGDVDGDGWVDVYLCGLDSANALYRNLGNWRFEDITAEAGVACADQASTGALLADADGDGDLDLFVTGWGRGVRLFLNDGQAHFSEVTAQAGLVSQHGSTTLTMADIDGDGDLDLYLGNYRTDTIQDEPGVQFLIAGGRTQPVIKAIDGRPVTAEQLQRYSVTPGTLTVAENGEPDILYRNEEAARFVPVSWTNGAFLDENGKPATVPYDWTLSAMFRDLNGDGAPDLYVCSDNQTPDRIWINDGHGRFRAINRLAFRHTSLASMGVDVADINRDGLDDIFVSDMLMREHVVRQLLMPDRQPTPPPGAWPDRPQYMRNCLFLNRGDGTYAEIAQLAGVDASDWTWLPVFLDVDLDGFEDLLIVTGLERSLRDADSRRAIEMVRKRQPLTKRQFLELRRIMPRLLTPNFAFRNQGDLTFHDMSAAWGFDSRQISQAMALADLDNDGDLDVVVNCLNAPPLLYRNNASAPRLAVRLKGRPPNTRAIGAKIRVTGGPVPQTQDMICGGRYLSGDDAMRVFAAGDPSRRLTVEVRWRTGQLTVFTGLVANCIYELAEPQPTQAVSGRSAAQVRTKQTVPSPLFADASELLAHVHRDPGYNDFARQPLLPKQLSRDGPGVAWADFNGDGWDDVLVGWGPGQGPVLGLNRAGKALPRVSLVLPSGPLPGQCTTLLVNPAGTNLARLLVGLSNYRTAASGIPVAVECELTLPNLVLRHTLPAHSASVGPLAWADVDGDGDLDLFVGGRVIPGRYPEPADSHLFRRNGTGWVPDPDAAKLLARIGLVSSAVFTDLDNDADPDLVLACDWGPLKIFRNDRGKLTPWDPAVVLAAEARIALAHTQSNTAPTRLSHLTGWWNGVSAGDFDEDGRLDLVAANWGRNSKYQRYLAPGRPLRAFYADLTGDGVVEVLEAYDDPVLGKTVPWHCWDTLAGALPFVLERFDGCKAIAQASIGEILGEHMAQVHQLQATTLDSMVFLNRGEHFLARPLPIEAQFAPAFAVAVADADGDGHEDLFLSQNFFGVDPETSRYDAGRGLWLRGDGQGGFTPLPGQQSGVMAYGEQRGAAVADFDQDGRVDLVLSQNAGPTKLYRNVGARPGLRVRLVGPPGNPTGVGAVMQLVFGTRRGPAREIHAGSGYWSQDSPVQVLGTPQPPTELVVRWPGGKTTQAPVPQGTRELVVHSDGRVESVR
jgi:hypothetical protein